MTKAIIALLEIVFDSETPLRRRIEATEGLLAYETPDEAVEQAKSFLTSVFEDSNQHYDDRLDALKLMRKAEARKITQPTLSAADERASREMGRKLEIARRRSAMVEAVMWPPAKGWADDLMATDYVAPQVSISLGNMAETVREGRLRAATKHAKDS